MDGGKRTWRDSAWLAGLEIVLFVSVFIAGTYNLLPVSHTPYLFALAWVMLLVRGKRWRDVGFRWPTRPVPAIVIGVVAGIAMSILELFVLEPFVRTFTGTSPDLSVFEDLRGNLQATLLFIVLSWVLAAFGEEMVWRGYAMTRIAEIFGGTSGAWLASLVLVNAAFGIAHDYQDLSGIIVTGLDGIGLGLLYLLSGRNLLIPIVTHGISNTCDFVLIYHGGIIPGT